MRNSDTNSPPVPQDAGRHALEDPTMTNASESGGCSPHAGQAQAAVTLLATVSAPGRGATDRVLARVADQMKHDGIRLLGALRAARGAGASGHCDSDLTLLPDGPGARITQYLGAGSTACRMDAGALEAAVAIVTDRLTGEGADLLILNKFGLSEAEGRGFRALMAEALGRGIPVLVGLTPAHRAAFDRFADGMATALPPDEAAILAWCRAAVRGGDAGPAPSQPDAILPDRTGSGSGAQARREPRS